MPHMYYINLSWRTQRTMISLCMDADCLLCWWNLIDTIEVSYLRSDVRQQSLSPQQDNNQYLSLALPFAFANSLNSLLNLRTSPPDAIPSFRPSCLLQPPVRHVPPTGSEGCLAACVPEQTNERHAEAIFYIYRTYRVVGDVLDGINLEEMKKKAIKTFDVKSRKYVTLFTLSSC